MSRATLQRMTAGNPRRLAASYARGSQPEGRRGPLMLAVAALIVVVAAIAAGAGTWYAMGRAPAAKLPAVLPPSASSSAPGSPSAPTSPSAPHGSVPASAPPAGLASLTPAAALYPGASAIAGVINRYFQAINSRDYAAYRATQSPGSAMTTQQFRAGFESTRDSNVLITSITTMPNGNPAADVTFTSQQQPQDGPEGESCTNWHVTMYFDVNAGTYTIGLPPNGYKAAYQACSS
jgi:hypothetical protein